MEDGDSNPPWNRLENPVSIGSDMTTLDVVAGPLTPYLAAEKPASMRLSTGETRQQNDRVLSNPQCQGRGLLGLLPSQIIER